MEQTELSKTQMHELELSIDLIAHLTHGPVSLVTVSTLAKDQIEKIVHSLSEAIMNQNEQILKDWTFEAKSYTVLLRDICFQVYKNKVLQIPEDAQLEHFKKIGALLKEAQNDLYLKYGECLSKSSKPAEWKHFYDPGPTVITQMEDIMKQIDSFREVEIYLEDTAESMESAKENIVILLNQYNNDIQIIKNSYTQLYDKYIADLKLFNNDKSLSFKNTLQKNLKIIQDLNIEKPRPKMSDFIAQLMKIPIKVNEGRLIYKEMDILKEVQSWKDKVINPYLIECEKYLEIAHEKSSRLLLNTKNRIELHLSDNLEDQNTIAQSITNSWENLREDLESIVVDFNKVKNSLLQRTKKLSITDIFKEDRFFLEKKVDPGEEEEVREERWTDLLPIKKTIQWYNGLKNRFFRSGIIPNQGLIEIIQFVKDKSIMEIDRVTYSLFLNKGYLGNSFIVKRGPIIERIIDSVNNWKEGFRGSILLFGKRLSGKSTIIESLGYYIPNIPIVQLTPDKTIEFKSRKKEIGRNLQEALDFVAKNSVSDQIIVAIDDLELWRDSEGLLFDNVETFLDYQNKLSKRFFFIINTNHWFKRHLDVYFDFTNKFTTAINTDEMSLANIKRAIMLRHRASLKDEVYHDHLPADVRDLRVDQLARKVAIASHQVIGASLIEWAHVYDVGNINEARFQKNLPQSMIKIIQDRWTIFHYILKFKITSERELVKALGSTFLKEISPDIQFLISCKILQRDNKNNLMINEFIVDEIESHFIKVKNI